MSLETQVSPAFQPRGICATGVRHQTKEGLIMDRPLLTRRQWAPEPDWVRKLHCDPVG